MKITDITVNKIRSPQGENSRSFLNLPSRFIVQVHTDDGLSGIAEGSRSPGILGHI